MTLTQSMFRDPAKQLEDRQQFELSLACKTCIHHKYTEYGKRHCPLKGLQGNEMSICGEYRPKDRIRLTPKAVFKR